MLKQLKELRKEARAVRAALVAPHNKRIKSITKAINALEAANKLSEEINTFEAVEVNLIPELEEPSSDS